MENVSTDLKIAEWKKDSLRRAIENLTLQWNDLEECLDSTQSSFGQRLGELESREKQLVSAQLLLEESRKEQDATKKSMDECLEEIESREKQLDSTRLSFEEQSRELDSIRKSIDKSVSELESKEKELNSVQQSIERRTRELESREKQLKKGRKKLGSKEKQFDSLQKSIEERCKELELRERQYEERVKLLELKEMQCSKYLPSKVKVEREEFSGNHDGEHSLPVRLQFSITMDGRALQIFLNERVEDHESMCHEVYTALQMSSYPAKLVLDAMEGFFPPHTKKGDKEFEAVSIRKSCTLLLAQLMRILPRITPCVKEEASKLAVDWKVKLEVTGENSLEVLGFLQLVGVYRLVSDFDSDEVFKLFETIPQHKEAPELCGILGFADKVPGKLS